MNAVGCACRSSLWRTLRGAGTGRPATCACARRHGAWTSTATTPLHGARRCEDGHAHRLRDPTNVARSEARAGHVAACAGASARACLHGRCCPFRQPALHEQRCAKRPARQCWPWHACMCACAHACSCAGLHGGAGLVLGHVRRAAAVQRAALAPHPRHCARRGAARLCERALWRVGHLLDLGQQEGHRARPAGERGNGRGTQRVSRMQAGGRGNAAVQFTAAGGSGSTLCSGLGRRGH